MITNQIKGIPAGSEVYLLKHGSQVVTPDHYAQAKSLNMHWLQHTCWKFRMCLWILMMRLVLAQSPLLTNHSSQATTTHTLARITETQERITETQDRIIKTQDQTTGTLARITENLDDMAQSQARVETEVKSNTVRLLRVENSWRGDGSDFSYEIKFLDGSDPLVAVLGRPALTLLPYRRSLLNITVVDEVKAYLNGYEYSLDEIDACCN
ncbi:uncharacterized protein C8R40DRAFT_1066805 [Lentinula edodes]|uniref:uncharacterized protein n=1 Tax=Lentinula edodes TaxID=5353 RepID=UPI001E8EA1E4|nr:uncharacterized protein C8R40DRAFT_1066805 [Lentinula edodes]KAH7879090.1 hypothetical protein C8R40DRAFT_1066805 [Lentinula edodes]